MKLKKCICALLAAGLILCGGAAQSFAVSDGVVNLLSALGVIAAGEGGAFDANAPVTRAAFARMAVTVSPYRDAVSAGSSVFKDVPASHADAPYIKTAVSNGLMSGYSDGSFRPESGITLEQAANVVLKLLGYTAADFRGGFPEAQMRAFRANGLSAGVGGGVGASVAQGDAAQILYNLLNAKIKDGEQKYAETIGFRLNASGEPDYAAALGENMNGPFTVQSFSSLMAELGIAGDGLTVYKNGKAAALSDVKRYDIAYFNPSKTVAWIYDKKITGIYDRATPSQNDPASVTVSGREYEPESAAAFSALSSGGPLRVGTTVTLLMGRDGRVADAVASTAVKVDTVLYVTETGSKTYENANGRTYVSGYVGGVSPGGEALEYPVRETWIKVGDVVKLRFADGAMNVTKLFGGGVSGTVDADLRTMGNLRLSEDIRILDTYEGAHVSVSVQRLGGAAISADEVLYHEAAGGAVTALILKDATGDCGIYGVITSVTSASSASNQEDEASNSAAVTQRTYSYITEGLSRSASGSFGAAPGPAQFVFSGEKLTSVRNLRGLSGKVKSFDGATLTIAGGTAEDWAVAENAEVYRRPQASTDYVHATLDDATEAFAAGKTLDFYYDDTPDGGGRIRVILIRE
ncbi:MAG: S-layer homology domain-containing protein [Clostridiales Family XIII bacterium]|nr:S-layer homology domain-containing protein [Clostridiales Family XIII bacterium]